MISTGTEIGGLLVDGLGDGVLVEYPQEDLSFLRVMSFGLLQVLPRPPSSLRQVLHCALPQLTMSCCELRPSPGASQPPIIIAAGFTLRAIATHSELLRTSAFSRRSPAPHHHCGRSYTARYRDSP